MERPMAGSQYPRSLGEFQAWFSTDADCLDYLEWLRWPGRDPVLLGGDLTRPLQAQCQRRARAVKELPADGEPD